MMPIGVGQLDGVVNQNAFLLRPIAAEKDPDRGLS
jgi:hypothetical protein